MPIDWTNYTTARAHSTGIPLRGEVIPVASIVAGLQTGLIAEISGYPYHCFFAHREILWFRTPVEAGSIVILSDIRCWNRVQMDPPTIGGFHAAGDVLALEGGGYRALRELIWYVDQHQNIMPAGSLFGVYPEQAELEERYATITELISNHNEQRQQASLYAAVEQQLSQLPNAETLRDRLAQLVPVDASTTTLANRIRENILASRADEAERVHQLRLLQLDEAMARAGLSPHQITVVQQVVAHPTMFTVRNRGSDLHIYANYSVDNGRTLLGTGTDPEPVRPTAWERLSDPLLPDSG